MGLLAARTVHQSSHSVAILQQPADHVLADKSGASCEKDFHAEIVLSANKQSALSDQHSAPQPFSTVKDVDL